MPPHRIRVCPLGVDSDVFAPSAEALTPRQPRTQFLNISEFGPRKNLGGLLRAWMDAMRPDDDALLTIKTGRNFTVNRLPAGLERAARVRILSRTFSRIPGCRSFIAGQPITSAPRLAKGGICPSGRLIEILTELEPLAATKRRVLEHLRSRSGSPDRTRSRPDGTPDPDSR